MEVFDENIASHIPECKFGVVVNHQRDLPWSGITLNTAKVSRTFLVGHIMFTRFHGYSELSTFMFYPTAEKVHTGFEVGKLCVLG